MSLNTAKKPVIALVGAGPGIGEAVARRFVAEGFFVALLARTEDKLQTMAQGIEADHGKGSAKYYITDLRQESSVLASFEQIRADLGAVSVLVYNAGARRVNGRSILDTSSEEFENFTKINLFGAFWATKCVLPDMLAAGKGTILFTGATGALRGNPGLSSFSPGKFGLRSLCQIITREYQAKGIHAAHIIVDTPVDGKLIGEWSRREWQRRGEGDKLQDIDMHLAAPADLAQIYWFLHTQPRSAWTHELDARPQGVSMFSKM
ncbi:hypothetical protein H2200_013005 [Cladophialophora chaetospira]|uniref:Uncharacterized protein n=1 Tax=Cladophialophora chaetospira TaxID=386627 RepID=A0AA38WWM9_9EURO|nr:hypothetical protein H2200_013005 [Cladophialophora chaetospira]